jgi:hypothetical protein
MIKENEFVLELAGAEPVYDTDEGGKPVFAGYRVAFSPVVFSQEEFSLLVKRAPYDVRVRLVD